MERTGIDRAPSDDVVSAGRRHRADAGDIARTCWLSAGLPEECRASHRRQCGCRSRRSILPRSGDERHLRNGGRRGVQTMSADSIGSSMLAGQPLGFAHPLGVRAAGQALRRPAAVAVSLGQHDRREVEPVARADGGVRLREPPPRHRRRKRRVRARIAPITVSARRRAAATPRWKKWRP